MKGIVLACVFSLFAIKLLAGCHDGTIRWAFRNTNMQGYRSLYAPPSFLSFTIQANEKDTVQIDCFAKGGCGGWEFISAYKNDSVFKSILYKPPYGGNLSVLIGCAKGEYKITLKGTYSWSHYLVHFSIHPVNYVALNELSAETDFLQVFPNPANDQVSVSSISESISDISLFSSTGNLVIQVKPGGREAQLNLSDLPKGMYSLSATLEDRKRIVKKLIVD